MRLREVIAEAARLRQSVVIGGDVFDMARPPLWVAGLLFDAFGQAQAQEVPVWVIPGNHDCDVVWGPELLGHSGWVYVHYINRPDRYTIDGMEVGFIPHLPRAVLDAVSRDGLYQNAYMAAVGDSVDVLISHAHAQGVKNSSDVEVECGDAIAYDPQLFPKCSYALFGHIHRAQTVGNVSYPGSVVVCDYSEAGDPKGYIELTSVESGPRFIEFLHEGVGYRHVRVDLMTKDQVEFPDDKVKSLVNDKLVKVTVYTDDPLKVNEWAIRAVFNKYGYVTRFETVVQREESDAEYDEDEPVSYDRLFETWLSNKDGVPEDIRSEALRIGTKLIAKVLA